MSIDIFYITYLTLCIDIFYFQYSIIFKQENGKLSFPEYFFRLNFTHSGCSLR